MSALSPFATGPTILAERVDIVVAVFTWLLLVDIVRFRNGGEAVHMLHLRNKPLPPSNNSIRHLGGLPVY
jgi:hypothetical protein